MTLFMILCCKQWLNIDGIEHVGFRRLEAETIRNPTALCAESHVRPEWRPDETIRVIS